MALKVFISHKIEEQGATVKALVGILNRFVSPDILAVIPFLAQKSSIA
jgi:hypothetical protein